MYVLTIKQSISVLSICTILYLLSPSQSIPVSIQDVQAKEVKTTTGAVATGVVAPIQVRGKKDWEEKFIYSRTDTKWMDARKSWNDEDNKQETRWKACDAECKVKTLIELGIREEISESLVINCKALAEDPRKCIIIWASIVKNESWGWFKCRKANRFNCFGIMVADEYKSFNDGVLHFIWKYNRYWYKANSMSFFYPPAWWVSKSRYCTSEASSGSDVGCPNWLRNSQTVFNKLSEIF